MLASNTVLSCLVGWADPDILFRRLDRAPVAKTAAGSVAFHTSLVCLVWVMLSVSTQALVQSEMS